MLEGESTYYNKQVEDLERGICHFFSFMFSSLVGDLDSCKDFMPYSPLTTMPLYTKYKSYKHEGKLDNLNYDCIHFKSLYNYLHIQIS